MLALAEGLRTIDTRCVAGVDEEFEWQAVQHHYAEDHRRERLWQRNLRRPDRRGRGYRREMRRIGLFFLGLAIAVAVVIAAIVAVV